MYNLQHHPRVLLYDVYNDRYLSKLYLWIFKINKEKQIYVYVLI